MTDDELIVLWSLGGMELWTEYKNGINNPSTIIHKMYTNMCFPSNWDLTRAVYIKLFQEKDDSYVSLNSVPQSYIAAECLYTIDDVLSFNPDEQWWKLLFAKRWYSKNKEQFHD